MDNFVDDEIIIEEDFEENLKSLNDDYEFIENSKILNNFKEDKKVKFKEILIKKSEKGFEDFTSLQTILFSITLLFLFILLIIFYVMFYSNKKSNKENNCNETLKENLEKYPENYMKFYN